MGSGPLLKAFDGGVICSRCVGASLVWSAVRQCFAWKEFCESEVRCRVFVVVGCCRFGMYAFCFPLDAMSYSWVSLCLMCSLLIVLSFTRLGSVHNCTVGPGECVGIVLSIN